MVSTSMVGKASAEMSEASVFVSSNICSVTCERSCRQYGKHGVVGFVGEGGDRDNRLRALHPTRPDTVGYVGVVIKSRGRSNGGEGVRRDERGQRLRLLKYLLRHLTEITSSIL